MDAMRFGFRLVSTTAFVLLAAITGAPMVVTLVLDITVTFEFRFRPVNGSVATVFDGQH